MEEIHASRLQRRRLPRPDVHHGHACCGTAATAQKAALAARDRAAASCACRRSASPSRPRAPTRSSLRTTAVREGDHYVVNGQKIWTSRAEHSDLMLLLARTTPREQAKTRTDGLSVFLVDMRRARQRRSRIRPIRTMMNHATTEVFFDDLRVPAENLIGEEGKGFRYILVRHERRAHPDRAPNASATPSGSSPRPPPTPRSARCSAGRSGRTRACSSRSRAPMRRCARPS